MNTNHSAWDSAAAPYPYEASSEMSTVLDCSADAVWQEIRDFNSYPAYIDGVTESEIEDDLPGDRVGCVRRFVYRNDVTRQTLIGHSDDERFFSHAGCEPLVWPSHQDGDIGPAVYENRIQAVPITDGDRCLLRWSMRYRAATEADAAAWKGYFDAAIPVWADSLRSYMASLQPPTEKVVLVTGLKLADGVDPADYERFAREVDKPTCERDLDSITSWNVHRVLGLHGDDGPAPYDYIEVVELTDLETFRRDLEGPVAAELGAGLERLVGDPDLILTRRVT